MFARSLAILLVALPAPALAQAYQCRVPQRIDPPPAPRQDGPARRAVVGGYILAASWSPEYCNTNRRAAGSMQCSGSAGRFGFILHGLWPEARSGVPPQWCALRTRPDSEELRRNLCMTPSPDLLAHEWAKHGSCMARSPQAYFATARQMWSRIVWPDADRLSRKAGLTAGDLRQTFRAANPGWPAGAVAIRLSPSGWLQEVHLCLDAQREAAPCARPGVRDSQPMKIWRGL